MTNIKDIANGVINRAKNLKEFVVKRDIEDVLFVGEMRYSIKHVHGKPVEIYVHALTQEEAELRVDEWLKEQNDSIN